MSSIRGKLVETPHPPATNRKWTSVRDVMDTFDALMAYPLKNTNASSEDREMAALAAEAQAKVVLYMLTTHTGPGLSEGYFVRAVTAHFEKSGITPISLKHFLTIFDLHQQCCICKGSK